MKCDSHTMRLYAVTDRAWVGRQTLTQQVESALRGGATCIQLREKQLSREAIQAQALELVPLCRRYGVPFIVNDDVDIALAAGADGVHLGQEDLRAGDVRRRVGKDFLIGVSAHSVEEALEAQADGADYLGVGAMFATATKTDTRAMTPQRLKAICDAVTIPVAAIGGISRDNLPTLTGCGADGVALVSAIFGAPDIEAECRALLRLSEAMVRG